MQGCRREHKSGTNFNGENLCMNSKKEKKKLNYCRSLELKQLREKIETKVATIYILRFLSKSLMTWVGKVT